MTYDKCKDCIWRKVWYHGGTDFSYTCLWQMKNTEDVSEEDCRHTVDAMVEEERQYKQFCDYTDECKTR